MREDTQKAIKEYQISTLFAKKNIEEAEKLVYDDEKVILVLSTNFNIVYPDPTKKDISVGVLFLTDKRMILRYKKKNEYISDITLLSEITKTDFTTLLADKFVQVCTKDKIYTFRVSGNQKSFALSDDNANSIKIYRAFLFALNPNGFEAAQGNTAMKNTSQTIDVAEEIEKLAQLRDKGILTEEEFQAKKTDLLSRM